MTLPRLCRFLLTAIFTCLPAVMAKAQQPSAHDRTQRAVRVDDELAIEEIGTESISFAPDGQSVAFTRRRAATSQRTNGLVIPETRDDVWLQTRPGQPAHNLTQGIADSSGWWAPRWSPDGQRLAMLSSRGGTVQLWLWERGSAQVRVLTRTGVDHAGADYLWVDGQRLLYAAMPEGVPASPMGRGLAVGIGVERAESVWAKAKRGEMTASVISTLEFNRPKRRLMLVDISTGLEKPVGETSMQVPGEGDPSFWGLSPNAHTVMLQRPQPAAFVSLPHHLLGTPGALELRTLAGKPVDLARPLPTNVVMNTVHWSADGTELAFFALGDHFVHPELLFGESASVVRYPAVDTKEYPGRLWRVHLVRGTVEPWPTGDLDLGRAASPLGGTADSPPTMFFTATGELLVHAPRRSKRPSPDVCAPAEWLVLSRDGKVRAGAERLRRGFTAESLATAQQQAFAERATPPIPEARLVAYSAQSQTGIYHGSTREGEFLWRVSTAGAPERIAAANTFLRSVASPVVRLIDYTDLQGKARKAVLTLPHVYASGQRVPLVVTPALTGPSGLHPERVSPSSPSSPPGLFDTGKLVAAGYAHLSAGMPTDAMGEPGRTVLLEFTNGIVPAVDEVIRQGIADPDRLFLHGQSSGGIAVIGLVTQTARFKAAVARAGVADMVSNLNVADHRERYSEYPFMQAGMGGRLGKPFWEGGDQLRRNSAMSYVDRVQTPLMIVHSDLDGMPMSSLEQFFAGLVQQRKPALFVRYFGEGHWPHSPANVRDLWQRVFAWYDQWGDIARDAQGSIVYENGRAKSRGDAPALAPADFAKFPLFGPGGEQAGSMRSSQVHTSGR